MGHRMSYEVQCERPTAPELAKLLEAADGGLNALDALETSIAA